MELFIFLFFVFLLFLVFLLTRLNEKIQKQQEINLLQGKEIQEIKEKILLTYQFQDHLKDGMEITRNILEEMRAREREKKERELEFLERLKRIDQVIGGTSARGLAGEEILREIFKKLPSEMIASNFRVKGKVVEFSFVLPNGKKIPIDSKWPAGFLLTSLEKEKDPQKRQEILQQIEKETMKRIKEVREYIDPDLTWDQAVCALPDSVYFVLKESHIFAQKENVILMPYSMVLPILLYIYRFYLKHGLSLDLENLKSHLFSAFNDLEQLEKILENKVSKSLTTLENASLEFKNFIAKIKNSVLKIINSKYD
ncbi:MAG: DNA recombination protein RmuC [Minisyncoccales bacterium]